MGLKSIPDVGSDSQRVRAILAEQARDTLKISRVLVKVEFLPRDNGGRCWPQSQKRKNLFETVRFGTSGQQQIPRNDGGSLGHLSPEARTEGQKCFKGSNFGASRQR